MEKHIYAVVISEAGLCCSNSNDGSVLPDAYTSYEDALAAVKKRFDRPWQTHDLYLPYVSAGMVPGINIEEWKDKHWNSLPEDKKNQMKEGTIFYDDYESNKTNTTQFPIDMNWFVNIYRLKLK